MSRRSNPRNFYKSEKILQLKAVVGRTRFGHEGGGFEPTDEVCMTKEAKETG